MQSETRPTFTFTGWVSDLARKQTRALMSIARTEGVTAHDALDAVQEAFETFLRLPRRALVGSGDESRALMAVIVRNAARNMRRRHHHARPHVSRGRARVDPPLAGVDELMAQAEQHVQLQGCVNRLAEIQQHVVRMRMLEEASGTEVASQLDLQPGHVAVLLHRAKRELLRCMMQ
ncbi:MAG: sigma-70 family RNA polymerase sigma factor [Sandaracinaceae bacterium]|nr:sigma-70 family RNA polymerase sigma factor [Sandaracinaceae bacterium]